MIRNIRFRTPKNLVFFLCEHLRLLCICIILMVIMFVALSIFFLSGRKLIKNIWYGTWQYTVNLKS